MFTGLIQQIGRLRGFDSTAGGKRLYVRMDEWRPALTPGESIAVNGICLTACDIQDELCGFDVLQETLEKTTLGQKQPGCLLNIERALAAGERIGGHFVTGHVDGTGTIERRVKMGQDLILRIACCNKLVNEMVLKGSIACDGVSLTVTKLTEKQSEGKEAFFETHLIPFTQLHTALGKSSEGDWVNIETDIIGKYIYRRMSVSNRTPEITMSRLKDAGFG